MHWDQLEGQWKQVAADIKSKWAKLTDDDMKNLSAKKDALIGVIQERYGVMKDEAERQVDDWLAKLHVKAVNEERTTRNPATDRSSQPTSAR
jgi:uncharacterized protein YjbJ (UPF0337 family)